MQTLVPMLGENNAATPIATRVKALVAAAVVQQQEQIAPSRARTRAASHAASSRPQSSRARGGRHKDGDARNIINDRRRERGEAEQQQREDEEGHAGVRDD